MGLLAPSPVSCWYTICMIQEFRIRGWRAAIAHVPQSIYLATAQLPRILPSVCPVLISLPSVKQAAEQAQIIVLLNQHQKVMKAWWVKEVFALVGVSGKD